MLMELYRKGFLCTCEGIKQVKTLTEDDLQEDTETEHASNCEAKIKMVELLNVKD